MRPVHLEGRRFGRLRVLRKMKRPELGWPLCDDASSFWQCECACGVACVVRGSSLTRGTTLSCGCFRQERAMALNAQRWGSRERVALSVDEPPRAKAG
jgi:hypothetical protein